MIAIWIVDERMAKTNDVPPLVGGLCHTAPNVSVVLWEVGGPCVVGKWMACGETF